MKRYDIPWKEWARLKPFDERDEVAVAATLHGDTKLLTSALSFLPTLAWLCIGLAMGGLPRWAGTGSMVFVGMTICIAFMYWQQHLRNHAFNQIFRAAFFEGVNRAGLGHAGRFDETVLKAGCRSASCDGEPGPTAQYQKLVVGGTRSIGRPSSDLRCTRRARTISLDNIEKHGPCSPDFIWLIWLLQGRGSGVAFCLEWSRSVSIL